MFSYWIIEGEYEDGCFGELVIAEMNTNSLIAMNMVQYTVVGIDASENL